MIRKLNTKGFGAVEALLIVVIVGLIGGVGYYVYNAQKKTNQSLDNTAKSQSDPQKTETKKAPEGFEYYTDEAGGYTILLPTKEKQSQLKISMKSESQKRDSLYARDFAGNCYIVDVTNRKFYKGLNTSTGGNSIKSTDYGNNAQTCYSVQEMAPTTKVSNVSIFDHKKGDAGHNSRIAYGVINGRLFMLSMSYDTGGQASGMDYQLTTDDITQINKVFDDSLQSLEVKK